MHSLCLLEDYLEWGIDLAVNVIQYITVSNSPFLKPSRWKRVSFFHYWRSGKLAVTGGTWKATDVFFVVSSISCLQRKPNTTPWKIRCWNYTKHNQLLWYFFSFQHQVEQQCWKFLKEDKIVPGRFLCFFESAFHTRLLQLSRRYIYTDATTLWRHSNRC